MAAGRGAGASVFRKITRDCQEWVVRGVCPSEDGLSSVAPCGLTAAAVPKAAPNGWRDGERRRLDAVLRLPGVSSTGNYNELLLPILTTILLLGARVVLLIVRRRSRSPYEKRCSRAGGSGAPTLPIHVRRSPRAYFTLPPAALVRAHTHRPLTIYTLSALSEVEVTQVSPVVLVPHLKLFQGPDIPFYLTV